MANDLLKDLLKQYEQKKILAEKNAENKKNNILNNNPELLNITNNINSLEIEYAKSILNSDSEKKEKIQNRLLEFKKEKENILNKLQIKKEDFLPEYECKICSDTGYITKLYDTKMCNCLKQKLFDEQYNKSNITNIEKENFDFFDLSVYSDEIDEKKYGSPISPKENIIKIKKIVKNFIENFEEPNEKNLLFTGNTGLGKTFLSNCIAKELLSKGKTVLYQTAPVMLDTIISCRFDKNENLSDIYNNILDVDLLIIDDLGTECINNMKFTELFNIINTRLLNQNKKVTKTVISTNLSIKNLFSTYDERIVSRFVGNYNICRFFGDDIRFKKK